MHWTISSSEAPRGRQIHQSVSPEAVDWEGVFGGTTLENPEEENLEESCSAEEDSGWLTIVVVIEEVF